MVDSPEPKVFSLGGWAPRDPTTAVMPRPISSTPTTASATPSRYHCFLGGGLGAGGRYAGYAGYAGYPG
ncbi:hypothetical protein MPHLCCUG_01237 [Mycolicibacterium phlei]|nr:hypothetical protein MPHLCCUG_01237 [Mycolicibacterium phlei]